MITLRSAHPDDLPELVAIDVASPGGGWGIDAFTHELGLAWSRTVVAERSGAIVGFIVYWEVDGEREILNVATHPEARRGGVGRALVGAVCTGGVVKLEVRAGNQPAIALYRTLGFAEVGRRRGYYQDGEDAVLMTCMPGGGMVLA